MRLVLLRLPILQNVIRNILVKVLPIFLSAEDKLFITPGHCLFRTIAILNISEESDNTK